MNFLSFYVLEIKKLFIKKKVSRIFIFNINYNVLIKIEK